MTSDVTAMRIAIRLNSLPSEIRAARGRPLPAGIPFLLAIAAGEREAIETGAALLDRAEEQLVASARFFVEQILLVSESSSYRVLGVASDAPAADMRRNVALYLKYLHPDRDLSGDRTALALRVTSAWEDLKTPDRRAAYDRAMIERNARAERLAALDQPARTRAPGKRGSSRKAIARSQRGLAAAGDGLFSRLVRSLL